MTFPSLKLSTAIIGIGGLSTGAGIGIYQFIKSHEKTKFHKKKTISDLLDEVTKGKKITKQKQSKYNSKMKKLHKL